MRMRRLWPLAILPVGLVGYSQRDYLAEKLLAMNGVTVSSKPTEVDQADALNLLKVQAAAQRSKIFLDTNTKDGRLHYGSIDRMIQKLKSITSSIK